MKLIEFCIEDTVASEQYMVNLNNMGAAGRILWGAAFCLAILKTIKVTASYNRALKLTRRSKWSRMLVLSMLSPNAKQDAILEH